MFLSDPEFVPVRLPDGTVALDGETALPLFTLSEPLRYIHTDGREFVVAPDIMSDLGSIKNKALQFLLSPHEHSFRRAFRLHDDLYNSACNRYDADLIFHSAMREDGCGGIRALLALLGVRVLGGSHYKTVIT